VFGWTYLETVNGKDKYDYQYVFTDDNGDFEIRPYDYEGTVNPVTEHILAFRISAAGAEVYYANWKLTGLADFYYDPTDPSDPVYSNLTYVLTREQFKYDTEIENITVGNGDDRNFKGWNTLSATDVTLENGGMADFKARTEVHINTEFHAEIGSEVHIFNEETFPECNDLASYNRIASGQQQENELEVLQKFIEIRFNSDKTIAALEIIPNPNNGVFTVQVTNSATSVFSYEILNMLGKNMYNNISHESNFDVNLSFFSKGIYLFKIYTGSEMLIQKLIIN